MTDPRIRYDILANAQGEEDVRRLAAELEKLDDTFDPAVAERARKLAEELRSLGTQKAALDSFEKSLVDANEAGRKLQDSTTALAKLKQQLEGVAEPTRRQTGELQKLTDQETKAQAAYTTSTAALARSRQALDALGLESTDLAATNVRLGDSTRRVREEVQQLGAQGQTLQAFRQLVQTTEDARDRFDQADRALEAYRRELQAVADPTLAQQRLLARLNDEARQSQQAFQSASLAQAQQATALRAAGVDTDRLVASQQRLPPQLTATAAAARQVASSYGAAGSAAAASAAQQVASNNTVAGSLQGLQAQLRTVQNLAAVAIGGGVFGGIIRDVAATADAYANLQSRIRLVTGEGENFERGFEGVFDVARRTNSAIEETGQLFQRLTQTGRDAGLGAQAAIEQALALTETINQATQLSGGSADSARAAITQLIQGLQSGVLRGEEFNSVMEQAPRLARALSEGLGVTTGELRKLANAGALTTQEVIKALQNQSAAVQREFNQLPPTVGRAIQALSTEWTRYVGEVDQANGISIKAAESIGFLSNNLREIAGAVTFAGQAWVAYKALDLAGTFAAQALAQRGATAAQAQEAAARAAATVATAANTVATTVNTAAKVGNAAATAGVASAETASAAASTAASGGLLARIGLIGKLTGALALAATAVALFGDLFVKAGVFIGEGIAKLAGYTDKTEELEAAERKAAQTSRDNAAAKSELANKLAQADDKALGLTKTSKALVAEFEGVQQKGGTASEAVDKLSKALQLDDINGIRDAGTALDELARRGVASGAAVQSALEKALAGKDLAVFEANARAAFDGTTRGAERLALAIEAALGEALRRTGVDLGELTSGISRGAASAINDVELLTRSLDSLRKQGVDTDRALSASLNKATDAATTERALREVIRRWEELGRAGVVTGNQLTEGLEKARRKLDEVQPGVNSLSEALRLLNLKTREELTRTADELGQAYQRVANSGQVSLDQQIQAYKTWREAALQASGGVETGQLQLQRIILEQRGAVLDLGTAYETGMGRAKRAVSDVIAEQERLIQTARTAAGALVSGSSGLGTLGAARTPAPAPGGAAGGASGGSSGSSGSSGGSSGSAGGGTSSGGTSSRLPATNVGGFNLVPPDESGQWTFVQNLRESQGVPQSQVYGDFLAGRPLRYAAVNGLGRWVRSAASQAGLNAAAQGSLQQMAGSDPGGFNGNAGYSPFGSASRLNPPAPSRSPVPTPAPRPPPAPATPAATASAAPILGRYEVRFPGGAVLFADSPQQAERFLEQLQRAALAQGSLP